MLDSMPNNYHSGKEYEGPGPVYPFDQGWRLNDSSYKVFNLRYDNDGLHIIIDEDYGKENKIEFISYEKLFKSGEIELIATDNFSSFTLQVQNSK